MTRDSEELGVKLRIFNSTITGKKVKIDKDIYDILNNFINTLKWVFKDILKNQSLFKNLTDYVRNYKDLKNGKKNIRVEARKLE